MVCAVKGLLAKYWERDLHHGVDTQHVQMMVLRLTDGAPEAFIESFDTVPEWFVCLCLSTTGAATPGLLFGV